MDYAKGSSIIPPEKRSQKQRFNEIVNEMKTSFLTKYGVNLYSCELEETYAKTSPVLALYFATTEDFLNFRERFKDDFDDKLYLDITKPNEVTHYFFNLLKKYDLEQYYYSRTRIFVYDVEKIAKERALNSAIWRLGWGLRKEYQNIKHITIDHFDQKACIIVKSMEYAQEIANSEAMIKIKETFFKFIKEEDEFDFFQWEGFHIYISTSEYTGRDFMTQEILDKAIKV